MDRRPLPPRRLPPICSDVVEEIIGINDLVEKFTVSNRPLSPIDVPHIQAHAYKIEIVMSRNVLRDPVNYIKMTVNEQLGEDKQSNTVVFRSRDLMRQVFLDKLQDIFNCKSDDFVFYSYGQDDNLGITSKELVYETDDDELHDSENCLSERFLRIIYSMMSHTIPACTNCRRVHNPRAHMNQDIVHALNNTERSLQESVDGLFLD